MVFYCVTGESESRDQSLALSHNNRLTRGGEIATPGKRKIGKDGVNNCGAEVKF